MDKVTTTSLGTIVDNVNKKYVLNNEEYIMLIKEQPNKVCLLYVTDCEANFWQKVLDILFFEELRNELHLNSDVNTLVKHFVASLKINSSLEKGKTVR